jgi:pyruvate/2-oxoglutarate/acetoin dehydrogenase E1 component/TPP-dependent pyruvate/acetoin dehydrogenase alpha subunit
MSFPTPQERLLRYAFMKLTRDFDARFEALLLTGRVSKWYSEVGNEATTIPAGLALGAGDALCTLHRDLGAILAVYLDPARTFPGFGFGEPDGRRPEPEALLHRLACQLLGKGEGFSQGVERSFHYGYLAPEHGILHLGMISHLGSMIPVAAGCGFAFRQRGSDRVAINFIGEGGTSTGDFHEGLNMAAVWKLPLILVIENNGYAFSTPAGQQYAAKRLSDRGIGYGIAAEHVDGNDPDAMTAALKRAVDRARAGKGPTLLEAMLGRMRGHAEGDDSLKVVPTEELAAYRAADPVPAYARRLEEDEVLDAATAQRLDARIAELVERAISGAIDAPGPDPAIAMRPVFAPEPAALAELEAPVAGAGEPIGIGNGPVVTAAPAPAGERSTNGPAADAVSAAAEGAGNGGPVIDAPAAAEGAGSDPASAEASAAEGQHSGNGSAAAATPGAEGAESAGDGLVAAAGAGNGSAPAEVPAVRSAKARPAPDRARETTYVDAINQALMEEMERDESVLVIGQDIGAFEGAFRTTRGLYARWPDRVLDTPIAESGTIGIAIGAAVLGYRPVIEMQFADFISCGFNQLVNVAAKLYYRWQVPCPIVVRLPSGGGVGAGPFHSQNDESWFAQTAGIKVICPATAADARGLLKAAIRDPNPVMLFEHKFLYRRIKEVLPEGEGLSRIGEARVIREGTNLTLIGYGASTWTCLEAATDLAAAGIEAEVIDLRTLVPYDEATVTASVRKTGRALVVHEAPLTLGFGAEVAARLAEAAFPWLDAPVRRVAYPDRPVPYARVLENALLPTKDKVLAAARDLLTY